MQTLQEWVLAVGSLMITGIAAAAARSALKKFGSSRALHLLSELATPLSGLLYVIGLQVFAELAPLTSKAQTWLESAVYVLAVILLLRILRRAALIAIDWSWGRGGEARALRQGFIPLLQNLITVFIFFSGAIMILKRFNYDVMSLLTALGVGSLAVGLAAKDTLSNMISGFTLIIDRNLSPGDKINLGGIVGDVQEIGLRSTLLKTGDGNTLIVPNSEMVNTKILNLSLPSRETSCSTLIATGYDVPFERLQAICLETIDQVTRRHSTRGKAVNLSSLAGGHQTVQIVFWVSEMDDQGGALSEFHSKLLARLAQENIPLHRPLLDRAAQ